MTECDHPSNVTCSMCVGQGDWAHCNAAFDELKLQAVRIEAERDALLEVVKLLINKA